MPRPTCPSCGKPIADDHEWEHIPPGEGAWLCWEAPNCIYSPVRAKPVGTDSPHAEVVRERDEARARVAELEAEVEAEVERLTRLIKRSWNEGFRRAIGSRKAKSKSDWVNSALNPKEPQ